MNNEILFYSIIGSNLFIIFLILFPIILKSIKEVFKKTRYNLAGQSSKIRLVRQIDEAIKILSSQKIGAIITIVNKDSLDNLRTDGIKINANLSSDLIISIFNKNSPLHDGAIIIDSNKITYAGTYYKITKKSFSNKYGARHRAAMGISETSDSLTIIISEETGQISLANEGKFIFIKSNEFQETFIKYLK